MLVSNHYSQSCWVLKYFFSLNLFLKERMVCCSFKWSSMIDWFICLRTYLIERTVMKAVCLDKRSWMHIGHHTKGLAFLSYLNQSWNVLTDFSKNSKYDISWHPVRGSPPDTCRQTNSQMWWNLSIFTHKLA
jgi:hypothetical protein